MALTNRQEMFCREYLVDLNATQAAIRAGYSKKSAEWQAYQLLQKKPVQRRVSELQAERYAAVGINAEYVLSRLVEIDQLDVLDILNDDGSPKPLSEWPKSWRTTLSAIDTSTLTNADGKEVSLKKIKWPDKLKNLELLGRHINVRAFADNNNEPAETTIILENALVIPGSVR